jgi:hypothetical protein
MLPSKRPKTNAQQVSEEEATLIYAQMSLRNKAFKPLPVISDLKEEEPAEVKIEAPINEATKYFLENVVTLTDTTTVNVVRPKPTEQNILRKPFKHVKEQQENPTFQR